MNTRNVASWVVWSLVGFIVTLVVIIAVFWQTGVSSGGH